MEEKKDYTVTQEQLARFAKALGHPEIGRASCRERV